LINTAIGSDLELARLSKEIHQIERAHGLREGEYWHIREAPPEWRVLNDAWDRRADEIVTEALRAYGHTDLATMRAEKPAEFSRRSDKGRMDVWGSDDD
jgi:hypothetical protein